MYIERQVSTSLHRLLSYFPAVGITGPRQAGKSTLLMHELKDYAYVNFDDQSQIEFFETDPNAFMAQYNNRVMFDEVQFVPKIFNYVKMAVDKDRKNYGKYILTGSGQFHYFRQISESLAGRIGLLSLLPLQHNELPVELQPYAVYRGNYPELVVRNYMEADLWFGAYFDTYINKDLRVLKNIGNLRDFRRFISLLAAQITRPLELTSYANDLGISVTTIKSWVAVLEASYIIFLLPPYYNNFGKRITKSPKIYFYDPGIVSYLTGVKNKELYEKGPLSGQLFENYVISEIFKLNLHGLTGNGLYYLRTQDGAEIDLIVDHKTHQDFIEIKKTSTLTMRMISTLTRFGSDNCKKYLLYNGKRQPCGNNIEAIPYGEYLQKSSSLFFN